MPNVRTSTISDAQIGRAFRRALTLSRGYELVRLADDADLPFALVQQADGQAPGAFTAADDVVIAAESLERLISELLEDEVETGRELAIEELFNDDTHGFNLTGISLGMLATAMHFAPGAPIQRELLYAVNAIARERGAGDDEVDDRDQAMPIPFSQRSPRPGFRLADACVEHLLATGLLVPLSDDSVILAESLQSAEGMHALRIGQVLAEQALLAIAPSRFNHGQVDALRQMEAHLRHVTDRAISRTTQGALGLALLCADYYATISPDRDLLHHYLAQGCAILDLILDQIDPAMLPVLANDLYGLSKVSHDAGMLDTAAVGYARSFELRMQRYQDDDDTLDDRFGGSPGMSPAMHWVVGELAVLTALEQRDEATARRVLDLVRENAEQEDDDLVRWQATYLEAHIARASGETAMARQLLGAIVAWGEAHANGVDDRLMLVDFLLVAWIELARLELQAGAVARAAQLVAWAAGALDHEALQGLYPDNQDDPNDTRHRLRVRLLEAQAWVAWAQGQPEAAQAALQDALRLISFALGAETAEGRHIAAQRARVASGEGPQL